MPAQQSASGLDVNGKKLLNPNVISISNPSNSDDVTCDVDQVGGELKFSDKDLHNLEKIKAELDSLTPSLQNSDTPSPSASKQEELPQSSSQREIPTAFMIKAIKQEKDDSTKSSCSLGAKTSSICFTASSFQPLTTVTTTVPASTSGSVSLVTATVSDANVLATGGTPQFLPISVLGVSSNPVSKGGKHVLIVQKSGVNTGHFTTASVSTLSKTAVLPAFASSSTATVVAQNAASTSNVTSKPVTITVPTTALFQSGSSAVNNLSLATVKGTDVKVIMPENVSISQSNVVTVPEISQTIATSSAQTILKRPVTSTSGAQMITKVIITNNPLTNQPTANPVALSTSTGTTPLQSVGMMAGVSQALPIQQAPTVLLASPTKAFSIPKSNVGTISGHQILRAIPGTPPKQGIFVLSPVKSSGKVAMIPLKSPHRIAPAPNTTVDSSSGSKVTIVSASATPATSKSIAIQASPTKVILKPAIPFTVRAPIMTATLASQASATSSAPSTAATTVTSSALTKATVIPVSTSATGGINAVRPIHVPGSKFQYVRLVTTVTQSNVVTGTKQAAATSVATARPLAPAVTTTVQPTTSPAVAATATAVNAPTTATGQVSLTIPIAPAVTGQTPIQISTKPGNTTPQRLLFPASAVTSVNQIRAASAVAPSALGQFPAGTLISTGSNVQGIVMVPAQYVAQQQAPAQGTRIMIQAAQPQSILPSPSTASTTSTPGQQTNFVPIVAATSVSRSYDSPSVASAARHQTNGLSTESADSRPRKPCNCTKSQCLKLYCDCFANGEFCNSCNCTNCFNNLDHEEERQRAIKACLDRNPHAFHPKIGKSRSNDQERRHMKGCNCKRSGCLKNYCECYEAKILCTNICKCVGCKNFEDSSERKTLMHLADAAEVRVQQQTAAKTKISSQIQDFPSRPPIISTSGERLPCAFITQPVVESTCQCLLAQAEDSERSGHTFKKMERLVLEEFGRSLMQIIEYANKTKVSSQET